MALKVFLAALVLLTPGLAKAGGCRTSYYQPYVQKVVEYVQPIVTLSYYQVPIALYSVSYTPAQYSSSFTSSYSTVTQAAQAYATPVNAYVQPVAAHSCEEKYSALKLEIEQMKLLLQQGGTPQGALSMTQSNGVGVLKKSCSNCHSAEKLDPATRFVMFRGGNLIELSGDDKANILLEIGSGRMPKNSKLVDADFAEIAKYLKSSLAAKAAVSQPQPPNGK